MTKQISCGPFTPAHPGRRENFARLPGVGGSDRAMESMPGEHAGVNREFPKNSINIYKFLKMFMGQTNGILLYELSKLPEYIKVIHYKIIEIYRIKKVFPTRICPQIR